MRNELWTQRIEAHAAERRTGLMYVLGAAHLLDFEAYDGLLTLLAQPAFQVRRVRQAEDIGQHTHVCRTEFSPVWGGHQATRLGDFRAPAHLASTAGLAQRACALIRATVHLVDKRQRSKRVAARGGKPAYLQPSARPKSLHLAFDSQKVAPEFRKPWDTGIEPSAKGVRYAHYTARHSTLLRPCVSERAWAQSQPGGCSGRF
jgi:hypothetical protein